MSVSTNLSTMIAEYLPDYVKISVQRGQTQKEKTVFLVANKLLQHIEDF